MKKEKKTTALQDAGAKWEAFGEVPNQLLAIGLAWINHQSSVQTAGR